MVEILNQGFVSSWALAKDLPQLAEQSEDPEFRRLCAVLEENYTYPVDSIVLSPACEVLAQADVMEATTAGEDAYRAMLAKALEMFRRKAEPER